MKIFAHLTLGLIAAVLPAASATASEADQLDRGPLLETLSEYRMSELLDHLHQSAPPRGPVEKLQFEIAQHRIRYRDPSLPRGERVAALDRAIQAQRDLITEHADHGFRPIWQVDLAEMLLIDKVRGLHHFAGVFHAFGIPSPEQARITADAAPEAFAAAQAADRGLADLRSADNPSASPQSDLHQTEHHHRRARFYLAQAACHLALLADDHRHYRELDEGITPAGERERLWGLAAEHMLLLIKEDAEARLTAEATCYAALALTRLGRPDDALPLLDDLITRLNRRDDPGLTGLVAGLTRADVSRALGRREAAAQQIEGLRRHPLVRQNPLYRLLLVDAHHRMLLAAADEQGGGRGLEEAYLPYQALLDDPATDHALKTYIYRRWAERLDRLAGGFASLPPRGRVGVARVLLSEARSARESGDGDAAAGLLERAARVVQSVEREGLPEDVHAQARYTAALIHYLQDPRSHERVLSAAERMIAVARMFPGQPEGGRAIRWAVSLLRPLHDRGRGPESVRVAYEAAAEVLLDRYSLSDTASQERVYFGYYVLEQQGRYAEAAAVYDRVPLDHARYFDAQRARLLALRHHYEQAEGDERSAARARLSEAAEQVYAATEPLAGRDPDARRARGRSLLILGELSTEADEPAETLALLEDFEARFADWPALVGDAQAQRFVALAAAGRLAAAADMAGGLMARSPDTAAAAITQVLDRITAQLDRLRDRLAVAEPGEQSRIAGQREELARTASRLAELLVGWARERELSEAQMLPHLLVRAGSLRLAGEPAQAVRELEPLLEQFPHDPRLAHQYAESLFALGDRAALERALPHYNRLIAGLEGPPYPRRWWNAQLRRLQTMAELNRQADEIPLRIRRLRSIDPGLGGPAYRQAFQELEARFAR